MHPMIEAIDLTFEYRASSFEPGSSVQPAAFTALRGVSVTVEPGEFVAVLGHNGSGKSTFAKHINVLLRPSSGVVRVGGLDTADGGVLVDSSLCCSDRDIFAVGDIAAAEHPLFETRIRTEHWANALKQPAVAAAAMLGKPAEYDELPYFFTDQYDLGMEYVGYAPGYDQVVFRGDVDGREFIAFWLGRDDRVLAGMNVNVWDVVEDVKALIRSKSPIDPGRLADTKVSLGKLVR